MRLLVVGGVAGGMSAAAKAKRVKKDAEIIVFERGRFVSYGACGMPFFLSGEIRDYGKLIVRRPEDFERAGIKVLLGWEVEEIDAKNFRLYAKDPEGKRKEFSFDSLVLATGARAKKIPVEGSDLKGVFTLKTLDDAIAIDEFIKSRGVKKVAVIGAGFIGLELLDAFVSRGLSVVSVDIVSSPPPQFDEDMVDWVKEAADQKGIKRLWGASLEAMEGKEFVEAIRVSGEMIPVDMVIFSVGVVPETNLAKDAGIELTEFGAVKVNERMMTSVEGIYAAGDCTHSYSAVTGKPVYLPLGSLANRHGRVAGTNAVGGSSVMPKVAGGMLIKFFDMGLARTGLTETEAKKEGFDVSSVLIKAHDKAHYYPTAGRIKVKLVWEKSTGRLLGAQIAGPVEAVKRIDVISALITKGATVEDLKNVDLAYSPPFSPVWDPLTVAANQAVKD